MKKILLVILASMLFGTFILFLPTIAHYANQFRMKHEFKQEFGVSPIVSSQKEQSQVQLTVWSKTQSLIVEEREIEAQQSILLDCKYHGKCAVIDNNGNVDKKTLNKMINKNHWRLTDISLALARDKKLAIYFNYTPFDPRE